MIRMNKAVLWRVTDNLGEPRKYVIQCRPLWYEDAVLFRLAYARKAQPKVLAFKESPTIPRLWVNRSGSCDVDRGSTLSAKVAIRATDEHGMSSDRALNPGTTDCSRTLSSFGGTRYWVHNFSTQAGD